MIWKVEMMS